VVTPRSCLRDYQPRRGPSSGEYIPRPGSRQALSPSGPEDSKPGGASAPTCTASNRREGRDLFRGAELAPGAGEALDVGDLVLPVRGEQTLEPLHARLVVRRRSCEYGNALGGHELVPARDRSDLRDSLLHAADRRLRAPSETAAPEPRLELPLTGGSPRGHAYQPPFAPDGPETSVK